MEGTTSCRSEASLGGAPEAETVLAPAAGVVRSDELGCQGTLIGPGLVLTAGSCAFAARSTPPMELSIYETAGTTPTAHVVQEVVVRQHSDEWDFAVLGLVEEPDVESTAFADIGSRRACGTNAFLLQQPGPSGDADGWNAQLHPVALKRFEPGLVHAFGDCTGGLPGSPIFDMDGDLLGIATTSIERSGPDPRLGLGMVVSDVLARSRTLRSRLGSTTLLAASSGHRDGPRSAFAKPDGLLQGVGGRGGRGDPRDLAGRFQADFVRAPVYLEGQAERTRVALGPLRRDEGEVFNSRPTRQLNVAQFIADVWSATQTPAPDRDAEERAIVVVDEFHPAVGQSRGEGSPCSLFLIAPDLALSAGHCTYMRGDPVNFSHVDTSGTDPPSSTATKVKEIVTLENSNYWDFSLLRLETPQPNAPLIRLRACGPRAGEDVTIIQYPNGMLSYQYAVVMEERMPGNLDAWFTHIVSTLDGASGAPVLDLDGHLVGIHSGGTIDGINRNLGVRIDDLWAHEPLLRQAVRASDRAPCPPAP